MNNLNTNNSQRRIDIINGFIYSLERYIQSRINLNNPIKEFNAREINEVTVNLENSISDILNYKE